MSKQKISTEKIKHHAEILTNRVKKRYKYFKKKYARNNIDCFRLYDWDIPEVRAVIDWYAGHLVIAEYVRKQTGSNWLPEMARVIGEALKVPSENIHIKKRRTKVDSELRYGRLNDRNNSLIVNEHNLKFKVNLSDFLDTGLYSDHRETRTLIRKFSDSKDFLNLFCYTGAFTCAAAMSGANSSVSVDRSDTNLNWAKENFKINNIDCSKHVLVKSDVDTYLKSIYNSNRRFTLAFVDPPSFFQEKSTGKSFDINRDHIKLLKSVLSVMVSGSTVMFSTNHQYFEPQLKLLNVANLCELTPKTIPEDYRNKKVHRCWRMKVK